MQVYTNWYWNQQPNNHVITVPTRTILHPQLEGDAITDFHAIPTSICSRTQAKNSSQRHIRYKIIQQLMDKLFLLVN